jgi:hypothetical protein
MGLFVSCCGRGRPRSTESRAWISRKVRKFHAHFPAGFVKFFELQASETVAFVLLKVMPFGGFRTVQKPARSQGTGTRASSCKP